MKKLLALASCFLSFSCFAAAADLDAKVILAPNCPIADINSPAFCQQFKEAAKCYCDTVFPGRCPSNMDDLYNLMMAGHKNLDDACRYQERITHLSHDICVQHWNYQRSHCR